MANVITRNSRTDRRRVFILGGKVGHVTRHERQLFKVKRSKVKVSGRVRIFNGNQWETLSLITQERIGVGASTLVRIIDVGVDACGILSRSVGQTNRK